MKSLFASNVLDVLRILVLAGNEPIHQSEMAAQAGLRLIQAQRALQRISMAGLVQKLSNSYSPILVD